MNAGFDKALHIASTVFLGKRDKGGVPYILHCIRVAMRLRTTDEARMSIAAMHDVLEDSDYTFDDLVNAGFSQRVVDGLRLMTHMPGDSYTNYVIKMRGNADALACKREDLRDNSDITRLKGVSDKDVKRMVKYQRSFVVVEAMIREVEGHATKEETDQAIADYQKAMGS